MLPTVKFTTYLSVCVFWAQNFAGVAKVKFVYLKCSSDPQNLPDILRLIT